MEDALDSPAPIAVPPAPSEPHPVADVPAHVEELSPDTPYRLTAVRDHVAIYWTGSAFEDDPAKAATFSLDEAVAQQALFNPVLGVRAQAAV